MTDYVPKSTAQKCFEKLLMIRGFPKRLRVKLANERGRGPCLILGLETDTAFVPVARLLPQREINRLEPVDYNKTVAKMNLLIEFEEDPSGTPGDFVRELDSRPPMDDFPANFLERDR